MVLRRGFQRSQVHQRDPPELKREKSCSLDIPNNSQPLKRFGLALKLFPSAEINGRKCVGLLVMAKKVITASVTLLINAKNINYKRKTRNKDKMKKEMDLLQNKMLFQWADTWFNAKQNSYYILAEQKWKPHCGFKCTVPITDLYGSLWLYNSSLIHNAFLPWLCCPKEPSHYPYAHKQNRVWERRCKCLHTRDVPSHTKI